jgi:Fe-S-cluster containining protein
MRAMECRAGCAACCIAVSISSEIPGMEGGKPAGVRCHMLDGRNMCSIFGKPERPSVCLSLKPSVEMCGEKNEEAFRILSELETETTPGNRKA